MIAFCKIAFISCILFVLSQHADGLTCYSCTGCNDPFSSSGITTKTNTTSGIYCTKTTVLSVATRDISSSCSAVNVLGNGMWCCQTDYCNEATKLVSTSSLALALIATVALKFVY